MSYVTFLDVGQGDCTFVQFAEPQWAALIDGGHQKDIEPHLSWLHRNVAHLDLVVVTHPDADHIDGIIRLVEEPPGSRPSIGAVLLPPIVHPTGGEVAAPTLSGIRPGVSVLLGDHLRGDGLGRALWPLEGLFLESPLGHDVEGLKDRVGGAVATLAAGLTDEDRLPSSQRDCVRDDGGYLDDRGDELEGAAWAELDPLPVDLLDTDRLDHVAAVLRDGGLYGLAEATASVAAVAQHERGRELLQTAAAADSVAAVEVRAVLTIAADSVAAEAMHRLMDLLCSARIPAISAAAPDSAMPYRIGAELWHLAPTQSYLKYLATKLSKVKRKAVMDLVHVPLPSCINRVSHVLAMRSSYRRRGVLLTGDAGFQGPGRGAPDSMSRNWEKVLHWTRLIDVPHHGGSNGHFFPRIEPRLLPDVYAMHVSVAPGKGARLPAKSFGGNVAGIATTAGARIDVFSPHRVQCITIAPLPPMKPLMPSAPSLGSGPTRMKLLPGHSVVA